MLVRNPDCTEKNCMQMLVNRYPAILGALQKALDLLLGVEVQKGLLDFTRRLSS